MGNVILTLSVVVLALLCMHHCSARGLRLGPIGPEGHLQVTLSYVLKVARPQAQRLKVLLLQV